MAVELDPQLPPLPSQTTLLNDPPDALIMEVQNPFRGPLLRSSAFSILLTIARLIHVLMVADQSGAVDLPL